MSRVVARGPGRVNLIGEHTDYNDGLALPFAIDRGVTVTAEPLRRRPDRGARARPRRGGRVRARGRRAGERLARVRARHGRRAARGRPRRAPVPARRSRATSPTAPGSPPPPRSRPRCAWRCSRPARRPDRVELAKLCSRVENDYVGAEPACSTSSPSLCGEDGHALRIDFRDLAIDPVPLELGDWRLVTLGSGASHEHAGGGYNERRAECAAACEALGIAHLRDADPGAGGLPDPLDRRVRHVLTENARVDAMAAALAARRPRASRPPAGRLARQPARRLRGVRARGRAHGGGAARPRAPPAPAWSAAASAAPCSRCSRPARDAARTARRQCRPRTRRPPPLTRPRLELLPERAPERPDDEQRADDAASPARSTG